MIKTKQQLKQAIEDASESWKDLAISSKEMREEIRAAKNQFKTWTKRNPCPPTKQTGIK